MKFLALMFKGVLMSVFARLPFFLITHHFLMRSITAQSLACLSAEHTWVWLADALFMFTSADEPRSLLIITVHEFLVHFVWLSGLDSRTVLLVSYCYRQLVIELDGIYEIVYFILTLAVSEQIAQCATCVCKTTNTSLNILLFFVAENR